MPVYGTLIVGHLWGFVTFTFDLLTASSRHVVLHHYRQVWRRYDHPFISYGAFRIAWAIWGHVIFNFELLTLKGYRLFNSFVTTAYYWHVGLRVIYWWDRLACLAWPQWPGLAWSQDSDDDDDDLPLTVYRLPEHSTHVQGFSALSGRIPLSQLDVHPGGRVETKAWRGRRRRSLAVSTLDADHWASHCRCACPPAVTPVAEPESVTNDPSTKCLAINLRMVVIDARGDAW